MRIGFYSGSFDPVTLGHGDVIRRAARVVDRLIVGIGVHPGKTPLFSEAERRAMLAEETGAISGDTGLSIEIAAFSGLVVDAAKSHGATLVIRGLRDGSDFEYESRMARMNGAMAPDIETIFLLASPQVGHVTATLVRQIALMGGDVSPFVSEEVARRLAEKAREAVKSP